VALNGGDVVMKSEGPADDAGQVDDDPIILAGFGIVREF
jgi:hypothetical protein